MKDLDKDVVLNGESLTNPDLVPYLIKLKNKDIKANMKLSQEQFMKSNILLRGLSDAELIDEIEINSLNLTDIEFIRKLPDFPNSVLCI